jgi:hypothetical protein
MGLIPWLNLFSEMRIAGICIGGNAVEGVGGRPVAGKMG